MDWKTILRKVFYVSTLVGFIGLALAYTIQTNRLHATQNEAERIAIAFEQYKLAQQAAFQNEQQRWLNAMEEIQNEANNRITQIRTDADAANASADSLREQLTELRLRAARNTTATSHCPPAPDTIGMLTDVLTRADERAQTLARIADERRAAGLACQQAYEALRQSTQSK